MRVFNIMISTVLTENEDGREFGIVVLVVVLWMLKHETMSDGHSLSF